MAFFTRTENFYYQEYLWQVMSFKEGSNKKIMTKIFNEVNQMLNRYSKVFIVRFDLRLCIEQSDNNLIGKFRSKLNKILAKNYKCDIGYVWVREQTEEAETPHYHYAVFLNGHKTWKAFAYVKIIDEICNSLLYINPFYPKKNGYMIKRGDSKLIQKAIYRLSYLAKNVSKGNRPRGVCDYKTSGLKDV